MQDEGWQQARLIPTSGISGAAEAERRATSALLAVLGAVPQLARALTQPFGAPAGRVETFIEVPFELGDARVIPDGLIRVTRGQRTWVALVEVKTDTNHLEAPQLEAYLDVARANGFDALLTISNQIPYPGEHPVQVDGRKTRSVRLAHLSWSQILAEAVQQKEHRGIADGEQSWIVGELIRYLEHPRSGALEFEDMGASWVTIRESVTRGTLRPGDKGAVDVVGRFDALLQFVCLRMGRELGVDVAPVLTKRERSDPSLRRQALVESLASGGRMTGALRIPGAVTPITVTADLRAGLVTCSVEIEAPRSGRPATRVNWLVRQLAEAPADVRIEAFTAYSRGPGAAELLGAVREKPGLLAGGPDRELRSFRIGADSRLGPKRGRGRDGFVDSVLGAVQGFHAGVLAGLRAWTATPQPRDAPVPQAVRAELVGSALSSQDGPDLRGRAERTPAPRLNGHANGHANGQAGGKLNGHSVLEQPAVLVVDTQPRGQRAIPAGLADLAEVDAPAPRPPLRRELRTLRELEPGGPAGWYGDPRDPTRLRWWTGTAWSRHLHAPAT